MGSQTPACLSCLFFHVGNGERDIEQAEGSKSSSSDGESDSSSQTEAQPEPTANESSKEGTHTKNDAEVLLIHETGFNIKIVAPGQDSFEIPVSITNCQPVCSAR